MATLKTPPYKVSGLWRLRNPWSCNGTHVYTCIAIRKFDEMILDQIDVYRDYYLPKGVSYTTFEGDRDEGASIVTILSEHGEEIHVPDSFIESYPEVNLADYHHIVLSASLGPLPSKSDLTHALSKVAVTLEGVIGRKPIIKVHSAPVTNAITVKQAKQAEEVRKSAITDKTTTYATVSELEKKYTDTLSSLLVMRQYVARLEAEKQALLNEAKDQKLKEENAKLQNQFAELNREIVKLKKEKEEAVKAERQKLTQKHEEEEYRLKQEIFKLQESLKTARREIPVAAVASGQSSGDWIRERVLAEQEAMRRRSSTGLQDSVRAKLEAQSQPKETQPAQPPQQ